MSKKMPSDTATWLQLATAGIVGFMTAIVGAFSAAWHLAGQVRKLEHDNHLSRIDRDEKLGKLLEYVVREGKETRHTLDGKIAVANSILEEKVVTSADRLEERIEDNATRLEARVDNQSRDLDTRLRAVEREVAILSAGQKIYPVSPRP